MIPYSLVDVFAQRRYEGNPLAVFDCRAAPLSAEVMQQIAKEVNFQETTFITGNPARHEYDVRIFTPEYEVPFAGHPTLGTAWVLANHIAHSGTSALTLHVGVGAVPVTWEGETLWLEATQPTFGSTFSPADIAHLLQLPIGILSTETPIRLVSTGLPYVIIRVSSIDAIRRINPDANRYERWALQHKLHKMNSLERLTTALYVYTDETYTVDASFNARMFCLENGKIVEDAATGSAASCLLAHLLTEAGPDGTTHRFRVEQGYEMGRPALIELAGALIAPRQYQLRVGGQVQCMARGEWVI